MTIQEILQLRDYLEQKRKPFLKMWDDIDLVFSPLEENHKTGEVSTNEDIMDITGMQSKHVQTEGLSGHLTNSNDDWFDLEADVSLLTNDKYLEARAQVDAHNYRIWLDEVKKRQSSLLELSSFYSEIENIYDDMQHYGTGILYTSFDPDNGFDIRSQAPRTTLIGEDRHRNITTVIVNHRLPIKKIESEYGPLPEEYKKKLAKDKKIGQWTELTVSTAFYPLEDGEDEDGFSFGTMHWIVDSETVNARRPSKAIVLRNGRVRDFPFIVIRMRRLRNAIWGLGDCMISLPEALKLNNIENDLLKMSNLLVDPPLSIPQEMEFEDVILQPGGTYRNTMNGESIRPIPIASNYAVGQNVREDCRNKIKEVFKTNFYQVMQQLASRTMTATQTAEISNQQASTLGPLVTTIMKQLLNPFFKLTFALMLEHDMLPLVPAELLNTGIDISKYSINYKGYLAQIQKRYSLMMNSQQYFQTIGMFAQFDKNVVDILDVDVLAKEFALRSGLPSKAIRSDEEIEQIRAQRQALQQQQLQMAQAQQMADVYQKSSKRPEPGSAAEGLDQVAQNVQ